MIFLSLTAMAPFCTTVRFRSIGENIVCGYDAVCLHYFLSGSITAVHFPTLTAASVLRAAPFLRLSETTHVFDALAKVSSLRILPTWSRPCQQHRREMGRCSFPPHGGRSPRL